jgi:HsdM N-terminal domain
MVMLADSKLRSQVDSLWDKLWSGGLSNPLDAIEQLSFLLFLKQLDERHSELATLGDAAKFVGAMSASRKARPHWKYAVGLLLKAAETRKITDVEAATAQMERALRVEGWL